jgi:RNA polymerase sigma-70 factor (ECF subfamily)
MSTTQVAQDRAEMDAVAAAVRAGDEIAFSTLVELHRRELLLHCYRMVGSLEDSEDLVQETFLRAWRKRAGFEGRSTFRAWLYRIATNACLDALERRPRRPVAHGTAADGERPRSEIPWLEPYPDALLEGVAAADAEPGAAIVERETIELAFMVAIQHLPPRSRAILILRDVLGWSARDTAALLGASVPSVNSALQRARATLRRHLPVHRLDWGQGPEPSPEERALLDRYVEASERADAEALAAMLTEDARFSMPPHPGVFVGRETIVTSWLEGGFGTEEYRDFRCLVTRANMQPAVACYLRRPGEADYRPMALDVLRIEDGAVAEITTFAEKVFPSFRLPPTLPPR